MKFKQIAPPDELRDHVRYFWIWENDGTGYPPGLFRPVSDGCPGMILQQSEKGTFYDQDKTRLPANFVYGQTVRHRGIHTGGNFKALGVCFYPAGLKSVFGLDADVLTDDCADADSISEKPDFPLSERLLSAASLGDRIGLVSSYLLTQIRNNRHNRADPLTENAVFRIIQSQGSLPIKELYSSLHTTERSLERKFRQFIGISPKLFSKVCRFQASLNQLKASDYQKLTEVAFANGYADQSHFIRVFKEFTGLSPRQYRKQKNGSAGELPGWM